MSSAAALAVRMPTSMEEAVEQLLEEGHRDPVEIAKLVEGRYGTEWVLSQVNAAEVVAQVARLRIGALRRAAEKQPTRFRAQIRRRTDLMEQTKWVPEIGYKRLADLTADDCRAIIGHYDLLIQAAGLHKSFFEDCLSLIESENVKTLGDVKAELPALPAGSES
jgi:hypothetical protein